MQEGPGSKLSSGDLTWQQRKIKQSPKRLGFILGTVYHTHSKYEGNLMSISRQDNLSWANVRLECEYEIILWQPWICNTFNVNLLRTEMYRSGLSLGHTDGGPAVME